MLARSRRPGELPSCVRKGELPLVDVARRWICFEEKTPNVGPEHGEQLPSNKNTQIEIPQFYSKPKIVLTIKSFLVSLDLTIACIIS